MCPLSHGRAPRDRTNSRRLYCQRTGQGVLARFPRDAAPAAAWWGGPPGPRGTPSSRCLVPLPEARQGPAGGGARGLRAGQAPPSFQCDLPVARSLSRSGRRMPARYTGSRVSIMATTLTTVGPFVNEPITDYRQPENVRGMRQAIAKVRAQLGREYDLVIGGQHIRTKDKIVSINPANPSEVIGIHQKATLEHVEPAMQAALAAFEKWQYASVEDRTGVLFRTTDILRRRKFEFNAWLVLEVGKNYDEAEADTAEAIDFLELYARQALL